MQRHAVESRTLYVGKVSSIHQPRCRDQPVLVDAGIDAKSLLAGGERVASDCAHRHQFVGFSDAVKRYPVAELWVKYPNQTNNFVCSARVGICEPAQSTQAGQKAVFAAAGHHELRQAL